MLETANHGSVEEQEDLQGIILNILLYKAHNIMYTSKYKRKGKEFVMPLLCGLSYAEDKGGHCGTKKGVGWGSE